VNYLLERDQSRRHIFFCGKQRADIVNLVNASNHPALKLRPRLCNHIFKTVPVADIDAFMERD